METKGIISLFLKVWSLDDLLQNQLSQASPFSWISLRQCGRVMYFKQRSQVIFLCTLMSENCWFIFLCVEDLDAEGEDLRLLVFSLCLRHLPCSSHLLIKYLIADHVAAWRNTLGFPYRNPFLLPFLSLLRSLTLWVGSFLK